MNKTIDDKYILTKYPNMSDFVKMVRDGVLKQSKRKNFVVDMSFFGFENGGLCHGCAATCAIQEIANKNFEPSKSIKLSKIYNTFDRANYLNFDEDTLYIIENVVDNLRRGTLIELFDFYLNLSFDNFYGKVREKLNENKLFIWNMSAYSKDFEKTLKKESSMFIKCLDLIAETLKENNL